MNKKKMLIIMGSVVGVIVLLVLIFVIYFFMNGANQSYQQIETTMTNAARRYYEKNKEMLPTNGEEVSVEVTTLVVEEYMKALSNLRKDGESCSGKVVVTNDNGEYFYAPVLNCGENYNTKTLSDKVKETGIISDDGSGLYEMNGEYVFRGERPNNILKFADHTWRIVKVNKKNEVVLLLADEKVTVARWDDRYSEVTENNTGLNNYKLSRIRTTINDWYHDYFKEEEKQLIATQTLCIGKRNKDILVSDGVVECSETLEGDKIGLLPAYDSINASLAPNCVAGEFACQNYNYMSRLFRGTFWTLTGNSLDTSRVYQVTSGYIRTSNASTNHDLRPVIHLQKNLLYQGGDGTYDNPYIVK